jgi:3-methyladenine DNA glycosylase AlkD
VIVGLADEVRHALAALADPSKAEGMQEYMKSQMPFLGVQRRSLTSALRPILRPRPHREEALAAATDLWEHAAFREHRYAALAVLRTQTLTCDDEDLLRHLIVSGAWWDLVDEIATKLVGPLRSELDLRAWAVDEDLWIRRAAIICQVSHQPKDPDLLRDAIEPNTQDRTFWITKAIGWALRDYAYVDADWVRGFVASHELAALTVREATKHIRRRDETIGL